MRNKYRPEWEALAQLRVVPPASITELEKALTWLAAQYHEHVHGQEPDADQLKTIINQAIAAGRNKP